MGKPAQPRTITIRPALNGFQVDIGCAHILFTDRKKLLDELKRYLGDPSTVEKEYVEKALYSQDTTEHIDEPETTRTGAPPRVTQGVSQFIASGPVNAD